MDVKDLKSEFGVRSVLYTGLGNVIGSIPWSSEEASNITVENQDTVVYPHPVAKSLAIRGKASEFSNRMQILSSTQGRHAPLRLAMEKRIMNRIQPRLPGLYSHHPLAAQLDGRLDDIDIADFINPSEDSEVVGMPHLMMERKLGLI